MSEAPVGAPFEAHELDAAPELVRLVERFHAQRALAVGNLWGSAQAFALAFLARHAAGPWLVCASTDAEAEAFREDLAFFGLEAGHFPARESLGGRAAAADPDQVRARLELVQRQLGPPERRPRVIVASALALLQPVPAASDLEKEFLVLARGQHVDTGELLARFVLAGFTRAPLAEKPGEVSLRGEILDVYPFAAELPLRVELFGDEIESLRTFDPLDQRSVETLQEARLCLAADSGGIEDGNGVLLPTLLARSTVWVRVEPLRIEEREASLRIQSPSHARALLQLAGQREGCRTLDLQSLPARGLDLDTRSVQALAVGMREAPAALLEATHEGTRAVVLCQTEAEAHRFRGMLDEGLAGASAQARARIETRIGSLARGFRIPGLRTLLVNHRELAGILGRRAATKVHSHHKVRAIQSFFELKPGDHVVHAVHGVARFTGLERLARGGGEEEHLKLVFADEVSLFVPASRIDLVQRFVGSGSSAPPLDKIGGQAFRRRKEKVERALFDLASELLEVQARRALSKRSPWKDDDDLVRDMIGAFPYADTADQVTVDREIRSDLSSERPMDRLLCGDVGFGKTELAVRAAFRVVSSGGQVAVLVPTTVLAQQHFLTFQERMADFPVEVAELSRYISGEEERSILERLGRGEVDVVIGTHRILSKDVSFARLGLVIVDEEQRFGVTHKEHFKKLRASVDVLTLTATPIPRTLHMSLAGVRDISALTMAPEGRQEIETVLGYVEDEDELRAALLAEKNRGGQLFFLHNRVESIAQRALQLSRLVPECSFAIGHGQMGARELKRVMDAFTRGDVDVLVATTIIESGIDIPAAGTIMIDHADHFGLSELHQLRGRVGRGANKARCHLLVEKWKPLSHEARERLKALEEMNQLGAGFQISMKDLEIRGAGNILGPQQSGNIGAVGYDMYCRLLKQCVENLQSGLSLENATGQHAEESGVDLELGIRAFLPQEWLPDPRARIELLRQLSSIDGSQDEARALEMLHDRFGRVPEEARDLVRLFRLKAQLERLSITRLVFRGDAYVIEYGDRIALEQGLDLARAELRPVRAGLAHLVVPERSRQPARALEWFESLLQRSGPGAKIPSRRP
ncbi:MAG: transcription-repair coupling factor [Planctomycetes bacterium]|nr:transcription-repair coupling factor [Planctomycetota bacterium]